MGVVQTQGEPGQVGVAPWTDVSLQEGEAYWMVVPGPGGVVDGIKMPVPVGVVGGVASAALGGMDIQDQVGVAH